MRITTHTVLIAATVAIALTTGQPAMALTEEQIENMRLLDAKRVARYRQATTVRLAYAETCEAAFAANEPMPEKDVRLKDPIEIGDDLMEMTREEISEQFGLASAAFRESDKAINDCVRKYKKRNEGS